eukprot:scaffold583760_cov53-Prasinocladus_malaysianus.AAC.1
MAFIPMFTKKVNIWIVARHMWQEACVQTGRPTLTRSLVWTAYWAAAAGSCSQMAKSNVQPASRTP